MDTEHFNKILNYLITLLLLTLWISIYIIQGLIGTVAWELSELFFPPLGIILLIINGSLIINSFIQKKKFIQKTITLLLSFFLAFPMVTLLDSCNFIKDIRNKLSPHFSITTKYKEENRKSPITSSTNK